MIACNHLDDQSISKLLMKSTSKNIASCDYKIPFCDYKIPFCDYKAIFAFDLMIMQSANDRMMTICTMMMMYMMMRRMMIMRRDCENWIGCDDALEAEAG